MSQQLTDSQFYMWRTVFALAHVDNVVTNEEIRFMVEALEDVPFSEQQRRTLTDDIAEPQNVERMFDQITDVVDQLAFFDFARKISWVDGDFGQEERDVILNLKEKYVQNIDLDKLVGAVNLELEDEQGEKPEALSDQGTILSFRDYFLNKFLK